MAHSPDDPRRDVETGTDLDVVEDTREDVREPREYAVVLHNDDYTTMEFVIEVLTTLFRLSPERATAVMLAVHRAGKGVAGTYRLEIAETKVMQVHALARARSFPLRCSVEPLVGSKGGD